MALNHSRLDSQSAAEKAVSVLGFGYDMYNDIRLSACKSGPGQSRLIDLDQTRKRDLVFPGGVVVKDVSGSIKCDKGERARVRSDILSFNQMSEKFNQEMSLLGKIPSGLFNAMFDFKGCWQKDAGTTKSLGFDGWFISLYNVELDRSHVTLSDKVKSQVPSSWDAAALAEFIENYGTHVIVGVKMGGKDVVHIKQLHNSSLPPTEVQWFLKKISDERFPEGSDGSCSSRDDNSEISKEENPIWDMYAASAIRPPVITHSKDKNITSIAIRRGGVDNGQEHNEWLSTVSKSPNVISMSFVPITSLLSGVPGSGFLTHAVNLYLRYKPPIEELHHFLEFQLPREWAPVYSDLPLGLRRRKKASPSLQFSLMGPKLYVNTTQVDSENRPVTGVRLFLEGKKGDHLAIHIQHLSTCPQILQLSHDQSYKHVDDPGEKGYYEPVKWSIFSHICTAPVQYNGPHEAPTIMTKAWLEVKGVGMKKVLFLRLGYSLVANAKIRRSEWDESSTMSRKSGVFSMISTRFSTALNQPPESTPVKVELNSAIYPGGPPSLKAPKLLNFVETQEMIRGPEEPPGYWVVTGAKLCVEGGKISIKAQYSLLTIISEDDS